MTRVEEKAIDAWAIYEYSEHPKGLYHTCFVDGYQQGYEQAKKDHSLTIEDLELLHTFLYAIKNNKQGMFTFTRLSDEQYKEALRRFNKAKEEKK